jgi:hypothetical protein
MTHAPLASGARRRRGALAWAAWLLALGALAAACSVDRTPYANRVYSCDLRAPEASAECGAGWTCHPGTQLGTFDFCAPTCDPGGDADYCAPDGALLTPCAPSASPTTCGPGLQCLRTNVTADEGLCLPVEVCSTDADCGDPLRRECLSQVLDDAYGAAVDTSNLWCLQGSCNELSPCEAGYSCLGGLPLVQRVPPICAPNCGRDDLCPKSFVCASQVLSALPYEFCLPGLFGFPCQVDEHCLIGRCRDVGSHLKACTIPCSTDADCDALYKPTMGAGRTVACIAGSCVTAFSLYMPLLCDPRDNRCPADATCTLASAATDAGVPEDVIVGEAFCLKTCDRPSDCAHSGAATSCLKIGPFSMCVPGFASTLIECNPDDPQACLAGLECRQPTLGSPYCTIPCDSDAQCQGHPWLPAGWSCRGIAGSKLCAP